MDKLDIIVGVKAMAAEHWRHMQDAPRNAMAGLVSDMTTLAESYYISGCQLTVTTVGAQQQYALTAGWVCFKGEVMPVVAQSVLKSALQVVCLVVEDVGIDLVPVPDLAGTQYEVMRRRRAKLLVASALPSSFMAVDAPRVEDLRIRQLGRRLVPAGSILPYYGSMADFDNTGLGQDSMLGWAICNGLNGTPDLRGQVVIGATEVPDTGAPTLPTNVTGTTNIGQRVGADRVSIEPDNLPEHTHKQMGLEWNPGGGDIPGVSGDPYDTRNDIDSGVNTTTHTPLEVRQASFGVVWIMSVG